jgi:hypothetical protein
VLLAQPLNRLKVPRLVRRNNGAKVHRNGTFGSAFDTHEKRNWVTDFCYPKRGSTAANEGTFGDVRAGMIILQTWSEEKREKAGFRDGFVQFFGDARGESIYRLSNTARLPGISAATGNQFRGILQAERAAIAVEKEGEKEWSKSGRGDGVGDEQERGDAR